MSSSLFHIQATPADDGNLREGCGTGSGSGSGDDADDSDEGSDLNGDAVHPSAHDLNVDPVRPPHSQRLRTTSTGKKTSNSPDVQQLRPGGIHSERKVF